jgi:hypothetical protein
LFCRLIGFFYSEEGRLAEQLAVLGIAAFYRGMGSVESNSVLFNIALYKGGGVCCERPRRLYVGFCFAHTFSYTPLNKGAYRKKSQQTQKNSQTANAPACGTLHNQPSNASISQTQNTV